MKIDDIDIVYSEKSFTKLVEKRVSEYRQPYLDAVLDICEERQINFSDANKMIGKTLRQKLEAEAIRERKIKGYNNALPI